MPHVYDVHVRIHVEYFGLIRQRLPQPEEVVSLMAGKTLRELFDALSERHGSALRNALLAPRGEPLPNVVLTVDGHRIADRSGMERTIASDVVVRIVQMPPFTGGG